MNTAITLTPHLLLATMFTIATQSSVTNDNLTSWYDDLQQLNVYVPGNTLRAVEYISSLRFVDVIHSTMKVRHYVTSGDRTLARSVKGSEVTFRKAATFKRSQPMEREIPLTMNYSNHTSNCREFNVKYLQSIALYYIPLIKNGQNMTIDKNNTFIKLKRNNIHSRSTIWTKYHKYYIKYSILDTQIIAKNTTRYILNTKRNINTRSTYWTKYIKCYFRYSKFFTKYISKNVTENIHKTVKTNRSPSLVLNKSSMGNKRNKRHLVRSPLAQETQIHIRSPLYAELNAPFTNITSLPPIGRYKTLIAAPELQPLN